MTWSSLTIKVFYSGTTTPVSNAYVQINTRHNENAFNINTGRTDNNGRFDFLSTSEIESEYDWELRAFDDTYIIENNKNFTISNNAQTEIIYLDTENTGYTVFDYYVHSCDNLYYTVTGSLLYLDPQPSFDLYGKINDGEEFLIFQNLSSITETKLFATHLVYKVNDGENFISNYNYNFYWVYIPSCSVNKNGLTINTYKKSYQVKLCKINDTIDWKENKTLINSKIELKLRKSDNNEYDTFVYTSTNENNITLSNPNLYGMQLANPLQNTMSVEKNHYISAIYNVSLSANQTTNIQDVRYFFNLSGKTENDPIIIEREPNVCMINKDLYDYANSLSPELNLDTSVTGSSYNYFYEQEKVGASYLDFYRFWCDTIGIQPTNIMSLEDFKENFVNSIASDFVRTNYALNQTIEDQFLIDSRHGYVFDRCFIPISAEPLTNYLTFYIDPQQGVNNCTISFNKIGVSGNSTFDYSTVENVWNSYTFDNNHRSIEISLTENGNNFVKFRRNLSYTSNGLSKDSNNMYYFTTSGTCFCSGSVTSLLDGFGSNSNININQHRCFYRLFYDCDILTAPQLISTKFNAHNIYDSMFEECKLLEEPPELPCEILRDACYLNMFKGCTSLHRMPYLNSTNLETRCYLGMFEGCTSLTDITPLPSVTLSERCYLRMFKNCTSLTNSPVLSATTLVNECYEEMFYGCSSLSRITALFSTDPNGGDYTTNWVNGVNNSGVFIKGNGASWSVFGNNGIPNGWDVLFSYQEEH